MTRKTFWLIVIGSVFVIMLIALAVLLKLYFREINEAMQTFMLSLESRNILTMSLALFALQLPFQLLFFPGYSLFIVVVSYYMSGTFRIFAVLWATVALWTVIAYFLFKLYLKSFLEEYFEDAPLFHWVAARARESQWKTSVLVRSLFFSNIYKNVVLVVVGVDFWPFYVPAMVYYSVYITCFMVVGKSVSTVRDYYDGTIKSDDPNFRLVLILFPTIFVLSLALLVVMFVYGYLEYQKFKEEQAAGPLLAEAGEEPKAEPGADRSADSKRSDVMRMLAEGTIA